MSRVESLRVFLERSWFRILMTVIIFINPLALAPQVWAAWAAPSVEGVSITMWPLMALIQIAMVLEGFRLRSNAIFWSMLLSITESVAIIVAILVRS